MWNELWLPGGIRWPNLGPEFEWHEIRRVRQNELEMITFLPYADFRASARVLDNRRLGKQRVEAFMILKAITNTLPETVGGDEWLIGSNLDGWRNHPATRMWKGHARWLAYYYNEIVMEWVARGFKHNGALFQYLWGPLDRSTIDRGEFDICGPPPWLGFEPLHSSHRAALLAKKPEHYQLLGWEEEPKVEYFWPVG